MSTIKDQEEIVTGVERSYALDTAALLGGNEYLVLQMIEKLSQSSYDGDEYLALKWALTKFWDDSEGTGDFLKTVDLNQGHLINFFTPVNKENLPRSLASGLLYCGRHEDTTIFRNLNEPHNKAIVMNMKHHHMDYPVGHTSKGTPCEKIALIYFSPDDRVTSVYVPERPSRRNQARRISESLALEKEMLSIINVFAIFPVP